MSDKENKPTEKKYEVPNAPPPMPGPGRPMHGMMEGKAKLDHPRGMLWQWLFSFLKPFKRQYLFYLSLLLCATLIFSITPLLSSQIIDKGIIGGDTGLFQRLIWVYVSLMGVNALINWFSNYQLSKIGQTIVFDIRNQLFTQLQDMSMSYFDKRASGDIISVMTNDVDQLNQLVAGQLVQIISSIVSIILSVMIMFILNVILAALSLIVIPIFIIMLKLFQRKVSGIFKETRKTISKVTSSIQDNVAGAKIIQAYGQQKKASSEFDDANKANYNAMVKARKVFATFFPLTQLVTTIITVTILFIGGYLALGNVTVLGVTVTVGVLTAFIAFLAEFFRPFMTLMQIQQITESALAASDRIYKLLEERVEIKDPVNPKSFSLEAKGKIELDHVTFGYVLEPPEIKKPSGPESPKKMPFLMHKMMAKHLKNGNMPPMDPAMMKPMQERMKDGQMPPMDPTMMKQMAGKMPNGAPPMNGANGMGPMAMSPEMLLNMVKGLEKLLQSQSAIKASGMSSAGGMGGGMGGDSGIGGGMGWMGSSQGMLRMLASIPIAPDVYEQFPKIVQDALKEMKQLIERERSIGYVLEEVSLTIHPGSTIAIVGETGAGKTTLIKLITRFYDINAGSIKIDGLDIRDVSKRDLRRLMGLVPQDAFMFTGTIRENLLYGLETVTPEIEEKLLNVSKFLGLHNFIDALPEKYETKLTENAANISIGQRQLISFARALLTDPIILMLDEATSSVDPYTETLIQDALDKARKGRTTIIIAHRLSTIRNADHIIVVGKEAHGIVEQGTHDELMALNGKYKRLLEMQRREIESK